MTGCRLGGQTISDAFLVEKCFQTAEQRGIVLACGARGVEVQEAFNTNVGSRSERQIEIVRRIVANGSAVSTAWDKYNNGEVICAPPPHLPCVRAAR